MDVAMLERTDHSKAKADRKGTSAGNRARPVGISEKDLDDWRIQYRAQALHRGSEGDVSANREPDIDEGGTVTYRRVQGGSGNKASRSRIVVNADGTISIENKRANLSVSIDEGQHAEYFLGKRSHNAQIVEVDVPDWFDAFLQKNSILQDHYRENPQNQGGTAPKITDTTTPGMCFELPPPWIEWLEKWGSHARIVSSLEVPDPAKTGKPKGMGTG